MLIQSHPNYSGKIASLLSVYEEGTMARAEVGDTVRVRYRGFLNDGTMFDSSSEIEPLEFTIGEEMVIPGFEEAVIGMREGDTKGVSVPPEDAFGPHRKDLVLVVNKSDIPSHINPHLGMKLEIRSYDGGTAPVTVTDITEETIILDGNHELAGRELNFKIELTQIVWDAIVANCEEGSPSSSDCKLGLHFSNGSLFPIIEGVDNFGSTGVCLDGLLQSK
jgi:peptidylprolyl isomerase